MPYDPWYIYGAGGLGAETVDILRSVFKLNEDKSFDCRFIDDGTTETKKYGIPVQGYKDSISGKVTIAIGEPSVRKQILRRIEKSSLILNNLARLGI